MVKIHDLLTGNDVYIDSHRIESIEAIEKSNAIHKKTERMKLDHLLITMATGRQFYTERMNKFGQESPIDIVPDRLIHG